METDILEGGDSIIYYYACNVGCFNNIIHGCKGGFIRVCGERVDGFFKKKNKELNGFILANICHSTYYSFMLHIISSKFNNHSQTTSAKIPR